MTLDLNELLDNEDPAWPIVKDWIAKAVNHIEVLPVDETARAATLLDLQVTTRSTLGAITYETGGLLIDHGWVRILGSGSTKLPRTITDWNRAIWGEDAEDYPFFLVADDAIGGFYAIDSGMLGNPESIFYFAPDTLDWEDTDQGYTDFVDFCINGDLAKYYESMRWSSWKNDIANLSGDEAISIVPPLAFTLEPEMDPVEKRQKSPVSNYELYDFHVLHLPTELRQADEEQDFAPEEEEMREPGQPD